MFEVSIFGSKCAESFTVEDNVKIIEDVYCKFFDNMFLSDTGSNQEMLR